ncbi:MAG TPA: nuclear transport factor 2 family protein [Terriglobia bacterium]|nr:nuclear transport factor 2 family protein [Terriglobia bacterium]
MDDVYAINVAKTEIREAYASGDVEKLLAVLDSDLIDFSDGRRGGYREGGKNALRTHLQDLFARYNARLAPIIIEIRVMGEVAVEYGWHELNLTPKCGGEQVASRTRYVNVWRKDRAGNWKLAMLIDNADVPDRVDTAPAAGGEPTDALSAACCTAAG